MKPPGTTSSGVVANLAAQAFPFLLLIIVTPILLRSLGREIYGALILFNLIPLIAGKLDLGIVTAGTRAYAQFWARGDHDRARRVVRETLAILGLWGMLLAVVFYASRHAIAEALQLVEATRDHTAVFIVAAFSIPIALINGSVLIPFRAIEQYESTARIQIVGGAVYWILCAAGAANGATLTQLVLLGTVIVALMTIVLIATAPRGASADGRSLASGINGSAGVGEAVAVDDISPTAIGTGLRLRPFLGTGAGAFVAQASSLATYHADKLIISALVSPAAAGAYAICASIASKTLGIIIAGAAYTFPRTAALHAVDDVRAVAQTFVLATRFAMIVAVAFAVPLIALASPFLRIWIGADFARTYALALQVLVAGYAINASSVVASNVAIGIGEVRMPAIFAAVGSVIAVVAVTLLASRYGATGTALAVTLGMSQALIFNDLVARRLGPSARAASWPLMLRLMIVALPVGLAAAAVSSIVQGWVTLIALGGAACLLFLCVWLASFGRNQERMVLYELVRRERDIG